MNPRAYTFLPSLRTVAIPVSLAIGVDLDGDTINNAVFDTPVDKAYGERLDVVDECTPAFTKLQRSTHGDLILQRDAAIASTSERGKFPLLAI